ncbi:MAG: flippase-like domain-containing protein [Bacteroidales bacterium]|nr:flippase-like domain-containing protein [Bacteroidales bacterium]
MLFFSFKEVRWEDFINGLKSCNFYWIGASMLIGILGFIVRALRWQLLLQPLDSKISFKEAYDGVAIAYLTNFVVPRAGEFARCGVVARNKRLTFEGALGTVVVERALDMVCLLGWMVVLLLFKWNEFGSFLADELYMPLKERFSVELGWIGVIAFAVIAILASVVWIYRAKLLKIKIIGKIADMVKGLMKGLVTLFAMRQKWLFILYTVLIWLTYWLTSFTTILAFPTVGHLNGADALFLMIVGGLGWAVPVQGGLGAYHFILSLALASVYGIAQTTGVIFATISHEAQALVMIVCGLVSLVSLSVSSKRS